MRDDDVRPQAGFRSASPWSDVTAGDDLEQLLELAERDPAISDELDFAADLVAATELHRERLVGELRGPVPVPARPHDGLRRYLRARRVAVVAAVVLLGLVPALWFAFRETIPNSLNLRKPVDVSDFADRSRPVYIGTELRDTDDELVRAFAEAMLPYAAEDHEASVSALRSFLAQHESHGSARFYLAASLEMLGRLDEAEPELERVVDLASASDPMLADLARWRLAQLWLVQGRTERAVEELSSLRDGDGDFAPNARELLERIESAGRETAR